MYTVGITIRGRACENFAYILPTIGLESRLVELNIRESAAVAVKGESQWSMF
jgi:hypothetical protein